MFIISPFTINILLNLSYYELHLFSNMAAERNCSECNIEFNKLYRIRHLRQHYAKKEWVFAFRKCLLKVKRNNIHYKYGGTWKSSI